MNRKHWYRCALSTNSIPHVSVIRHDQMLLYKTSLKRGHIVQTIFYERVGRILLVWTASQNYVSAQSAQWWYINSQLFTELQGSLGDVTQQAGYTRIEAAGDMFWWFYPTSQANRPVLVWLSGVTDLPPSLAANIGMFGPYDHNMNRREDSWVCICFQTERRSFYATTEQIIKWNCQVGVASVPCHKRNSA